MSLPGNSNRDFYLEIFLFGTEMVVIETRQQILFTLCEFVFMQVYLGSGDVTEECKALCRELESMTCASLHQSWVGALH